VKVIAACDGRNLAAFLAEMARTIPLQDTELLFVHVLDSSFEEGWQQMAGHHWLGRHPGPHAHDHVHEAVERSSQEILAEAMALSRDWPVAARRPVELRGNPERELVRLALAERADLLAVGQHRIELSPHAIGRCARFVIDHAPCSVLVVRDDTIRSAAVDLLGDRLKKPK
jgi:nucleotide-binding universal stress UspA family protein